MLQNTRQNTTACHACMRLQHCSLKLTYLYIYIYTYIYIYITDQEIAPTTGCNEKLAASGIWHTHVLFEQSISSEAHVAAQLAASAQLAVAMSPEMRATIDFLEAVKHERLCLSCWLDVLKESKYLTECLGLIPALRVSDHPPFCKLFSVLSTCFQR